MSLSQQFSFNAADWYWTASDGRIYSSKRNLLVYSNDTGYRSFLAAQGGNSTPWPSDIAGKQTAAELQLVLAYYGINVTVPGP